MASPAPTPAAVLEPVPEPLRLPRGSVRGLLALGLMATFGYMLLQTTPSTPPSTLVNAVVVALAFYFGTRGPSTTPAPAPTAAPTRLRRPWIVRGLLILGFGGLWGWYYVRGTPIPSVLTEVVEVLGGYLVGAVLSWVFHRRSLETSARRRIAMIFRDLSAVGALGLTAFACYSFVTGIAGTFSRDIEQALSLVITYYFGSRVIAH